MESLYVCLFSNGHIKVGRSIDPQSRIASHVERVSCMGVSLDQSYLTECPDQCEARERVLIERCGSNASERFHSEWFAGLEFGEVTRWAYEAAHEDVPARPPRATRWATVIAELKAAGWTQTALANECGCAQPTISRLGNGWMGEPLYSTGEALLRLHAAIQRA